jgi:alcohol dehydrogenase (cytochrome c)
VAKRTASIFGRKFELWFLFGSSCTRLHWAGVLSTAGKLVFSGSDEGNFYALDALTGKPLWDFQTGGGITANPISFTVDGQQRIAMSGDHVLYVFGL